MAKEAKYFRLFDERQQEKVFKKYFKYSLQGRNEGIIMYLKKVLNTGGVLWGSVKV